MSSHDMPALSRPDHAHVRPAHNVGPELGELSTGLTNYIPSIHNASGLMRNPITADGELTFGAKGIPPPMLAPQPTSPGYLTAASGMVNCCITAIEFCTVYDYYIYVHTSKQQSTQAD